MQYSAPDLFSYNLCTVKVQKSKAGTSRVVVFREMGLTNRWVLGAWCAAQLDVGVLQGMGLTNRWVLGAWCAAQLDVGVL